MKEKFKYLLSNIFIFGIGTFLTKLIMLLLMPLHTSILTTEQYGIAEMINNSIEVVLPIATLCIIDAVFRFAIDEDADCKSLLTTAISVMLKSYVIMLIICVGYYLLSGYEYTFYFYFLYVATTVHKLFSQFSRGLGHIKRFAISGIINSITLVVLNVIFLVFLKMGIKGYLLSLIMAHVIAGVFSFFVSKAYIYIEKNRINRVLLRNMLIFSVPNIPNMLSWWINNISSRYFILGFCGVGIAGMFTAASKLPSIVHLLSTIFQQAWQYSSSKEIKSEDSSTFFTDVFKYYSSFIFIACSAIISVTPYITVFILRGEFYKAWVYIPLLMLSATIGCFSTFFGTFYTAVKNNKMAMVSTGIGAAVSIVLNITLIPFIGVYGALFSSVVSYLVITAIRMVDTKKYVSMKINYSLLGLQFFIILTQAIVITIGNINAFIFSITCFFIIVLLNINSIIGIVKIAYKLVKRKKEHNFEQ